jgi:hypothetical protein
MAEPDSQQIPTGFLSDPVPHSDANGIGAFPAPPAPGPGDADDERPVGGISVIPIPRREIARLEGTLLLSGLGRHKPTIVFGAGQRSRDADDE